MIPLYRSLTLLSCLGFAAAVPTHSSAREPLDLPLVGGLSPISAEDFIIAAGGLRDKYGYRQSSPLERRAPTPTTIAGVEIWIGTPHQPLVVVVDTGSVELWIKNPDFDEGASTTYKPAGGPVTITSHSDPVTGGIAEDVVGFDTFSVEAQHFLLADTFPPTVPGAINGYAGVAAPDAKSTLGTASFVPALLAKYPSNEPEISYKFPTISGHRETRAELHNDQSRGVLTIGGQNSSLFTGDVEFLPLVTFGGLRTHWALPVLGITVGGENVALPPGGVATIDTGSPFIGGPPDAVAAIYAKVPGARPLDGDLAGYYGFPCDAIIKICICFGGKLWPIDPQEMNLGPTSNDPSICIGAIFNLEASTKRNQDKDKPDWDIGVTFLRNVYSVFRYEPSAIGFAQLA